MVPIFRHIILSLFVLHVDLPSIIDVYGHFLDKIMRNKKEIKSGVYQIINITNSHKYIGSSVDIRNRWNCHRNTLHNNKHTSIYLQRAYNKYGYFNFFYQLLEETINDTKILLEREQYYINLLKPEYNMNPTSSANFNLKYHPRKEEIIVKMIESRRVKLESLTLEQRKLLHGYKHGKSRIKCSMCNKIIQGVHNTSGKCITCKPIGKPVEINGQFFKTIKEASEKLGLSHSTITKRIKANLPNYKFVTE